MSARVHDVEAGADDPDHGTARGERTLVGGGVDPDGEPAHHREPGPGERRTELVGVGHAVGRRGPRPDDRDTALPQRVGGIAFAEEDGGPAGDVVDRVARASLDVDAGAARGEEPRHPFSRRRLPPDPGQRAAGGEVFGRRAFAEHRRGEPAFEPRERTDRAAASLEERPEAGGRHVGKAGQGRRRDLFRIQRWRCGTPGVVVGVHGTSPRSSAARSRWLAVTVAESSRSASVRVRPAGCGWRRGR